MLLFGYLASLHNTLIVPLVDKSTENDQGLGNVEVEISSSVKTANVQSKKEVGGNNDIRYNIFVGIRFPGLDWITISYAKQERNKLSNCAVRTQWQSLWLTINETLPRCCMNRFRNTIIKNVRFKLQTKSQQ